MGSWSDKKLNAYKLAAKFLFLPEDILFRFDDNYITAFNKLLNIINYLFA